MDEKFVYAVYDRIEEANKAVQNLTNAGIPVSAISLYADDDVVEEANQSDSIVEIEELEDVESKSFWNRITDFFSGGDDEENFPVDFKGYQDELDDDKILVVVDKTYEGEALSVDTEVNVMGENDPNQVETFAHNEDYPLPDKENDTDKAVFVAGDMGAESDYSKEHHMNKEEVNHTDPDDRNYNVTENVQYDRANMVAGDNAHETDDAESYYTNIDTHRQNNVKDVELNAKTTYENDPISDKKLRSDRDKNAVAGDMGDSSDYSQYYHANQDEATPTSTTDYHDEEYYLKGEETKNHRESEEKRREYRGVADIKRPVTNRSNNDPRLGDFEGEMRRFDDYPPADEESVNPEQYGAEDKGPQNFNTPSQEDTDDYAGREEEGHQLGEFEADMRRHDDNPPADEDGVNPEQYEDKN